MLSNLSNNNAGNQTKSVIEKKHYEAIEDRLDELQDAIDSNTESINQNAQDISGLDERMGVVEENSTFPELNTDTINPATGDKVEITSDLDVDGEVEANSVKTNSLSVNGTNFTTVKDNAAQAKSTAETAKNKADEAYDLADAVADELADYKADNEQSITTGTLNADSVVTDSIAAQTVNTNDFETTNAEIDKLYVDTIKATGFLELPTAGQSYYTITVPAKTTASLSGVYTSDNNTDYPYYFTVSDGAVIYKQGSTEIIKDISFDRETGYTKVRVKSSTNLTYISSALDSNPVTIEDGGDAYTDYAFIPQKTGGYLIRGYDDTTTEVYIAGVLRAYAMSVEEEIIERTSVDFLKVNASIELPKEWDAGGTISYSTGEENEYISAQKKAGVVKPTWTSPIHSTIGSLSYSSKLVDEATVASYKGISETRQTQTISITEEASLQQLTAFHWTKNGTYWQPYELTRITIGDHTMWIDPTEANQGIRFYNNQVIADGTWNDVPVEEANAVPVNLVIFDAPTELSFPITNLGDKTTVHGEITATCFKGNVLGNVTGNADTATNSTCFDNKTYAEAKADILSGKAAQAALADLATNSTCFDGKTYSQACTDILSGNAATATNANNADNFDGKDYATAKADILSGCAANANNSTCFNGCTYAQAKADILSGNAASATNATCFDGCTYAQAKADILSGCAADSNKFNNKDYATACADILAGKACTSCLADCACTVKRVQSNSSSAIPVVLTDAATAVDNGQILVDCDNKLTYTPSTDTLCTGNLEATTDVKAANVCGSTLVKGAALCSTGDLNVDGNAYVTGDLTVQGTITTTHSEEVVTPSENIILRDGATTPVAPGCYSGFTVTNYDGQNNLEVGADKDGTLHVGVVGGTMEPIATRATEACMEDGYAAHWDSTGTDLVTKGATNTHNLCINGNATATGTITGTFSGNLTGNVTGNVTGNADTATNATCFGGKTYAQAKTDILSGCAADSKKLAGKTYACAKADILSGHAASAAYATKVVPFCASEDEEKNLAFFNSDVDCGNPDTIQYDAGKNLTFNPVSNNLTVAGDVKAKNSVRRGEYYNISSGNVGKYVLLAQASYAYNGNHDLSLAGSITNGSFMLNRFSLSARVSGSAVEGSLFRMLYNVGNYYKATYEFDAASATITVRLYAKLTYQYQRIRIAIDNFTKGDVYPFASTYDSALTLPMTVSATMTGTEITTTYVKVENASCADNSTCFNGCTYAQAKSDIRSGLISDIAVDVNCGTTCVCTLNNGSTLALSANAFNENAKISTTTYPGACCTGTSNYVVTTMVCCAKTVCRLQATSGTCHLALFPNNTANDSSSIHASNACPITYSPATGTLNVQKVCQCVDSYHAQLPSPNNTTRYITLKLGNANGYAEFTSTVDIDVFNNHVHANVKVSNGVVTLNEISRTIDYGIKQYLLGDYDSTNKTITVYFTFTNYREANIVSSTPIVEASVSATAPTGTFVDIPYANRTSYINTSSSNAEYPLVFSTCCATPASSFNTLYNDSANNLMYNPSTNTLTTTYVCASTRFIAGCPTECTSSVVGAQGGCFAQGYIELYHATPFIDMHVNNACANYSHRLIAINGYLRVTATNATGCCAATQNANFDFCSDGTLVADTVRVGSSYKFNADKADNSGRPTLHLLRDITCVVCCSNCGWAAIGKACLVRCPNSAAAYSGSRCIDFQVLMQYGTTGTSNAVVETLSKYTNAIKPVIVTRNDGCVYFAICSTSSGNMTYDMQGACCVICEVCYNGTAYTDTNGTFTISKEGSLAEITSCVSNATCFGGCTYAQAKADILLGEAETSTYTNINDVNSGAQNILMTSATGTLGVVNASTGTNACPLTYNPATGVLNACEVDTNIIKLGELDYITNGVDIGDTYQGEMLISNYDGFTICAKHPTCHSSSHNWAYVVACCSYTSLGWGARASDRYSVALGALAVTDRNAIAIGYNACACCNSINIGKTGCVWTPGGNRGVAVTLVNSHYNTSYYDGNGGMAIITFTNDTKECELYNVFESIFGSKAPSTDGTYCIGFVNRILQKQSSDYIRDNSICYKNLKMVIDSGSKCYTIDDVLTARPNVTTAAASNLYYFNTAFIYY